jgi:general secretion pathway protein I
MKRQRAFTLVEILVALAILAIALTAGMRALTQATDTATALKFRTLALWVPKNRLAAAQIALPWPAREWRSSPFPPT